MIKLRDLEGVTTVFVTHDLPAAVMVASEYAATETDGKLHMEKGGESLCLVNVNFIMLQNTEICFEGNLQQLLESKDSYIRKFVS
jgi:phospholipid/cholesterol/gamma-HCH transport system ATP-binding protein